MSAAAVAVALRRRREEQEQKTFADMQECDHKDCLLVIKEGLDGLSQADIDMLHNSNHGHTQAYTVHKTYSTSELQAIEQAQTAVGWGLALVGLAAVCVFAASRIKND